MLLTPLQLWLTGPRVIRTVNHDKPIIQGIKGSSEVSFDGQYTYETHKMSNSMVLGGIEKSTSGPPRHIHLQETEYFKVISGVMGAELNGKVVNLTPSDPEFKIPPGLPHRFWPETSSDDMKIQVRVEGGTGDGGFGEKFMRNLVGYLKDSDDQGIAISPFQMMLFMYSNGILLALPLPLFLVKLIHHVGGFWIGKGLLGYQASYPEYWQEKKGL